MTKTKSIIILLMTVCLILVISARVYAQYTPVGIPNSVSYVDSSASTPIIIFVGDSRTMQCTFGNNNASVLKNCVFCYVNGGSSSVINYKNGKLSGILKNLLHKYRNHDTIVIFNLGVNGNGNPTKNANRTAKIYNKWIKAYPGIKFYVESVWPTKITSKKNSYRNSNVIKFNKILKAKYANKGLYIDAYNYIKLNDLMDGGMRDKVHYKWNSTKKILKFTRTCAKLYNVQY